MVLMIIITIIIKSTTSGNMNTRRVGLRRDQRSLGDMAIRQVYTRHELMSLLTQRVVFAPHAAAQCTLTGTGCCNTTNGIAQERTETHVILQPDYPPGLPQALYMPSDAPATVSELSLHQLFKAVAQTNMHKTRNTSQVDQPWGKAHMLVQCSPHALAN
jgi:hypothetical protein